MPKLRVISARAGRLVRGAFRSLSAKNARKARNIAQGFYDKGGTFHPIRSSADYDPSRAGEGRKRKAAKAAKRKTAPKKRKAARSVKAARATKKKRKATAKRKRR